MSIAEIEAELDRLPAEDLRRLALKSWSAFLNRTSGSGSSSECDEEDPELLAALDATLARVDAGKEAFQDGAELRAGLSEWTSR